MKISLAYGRDGLVVDLPDDRTDVVTPRHLPALADPVAAIVHALDNTINCQPLRQTARPGQQLVVSVCDITRAQPREQMLQALFRHLDGVIAPEDVTILVATGTHRGNTDAELRAMLGDDVVARCRIVNHDARDHTSLTFVGDTDDGVPVWLNRIWVEADLRVTTGFVEPHFFAGFSGGPKMVAPGLAGLDTVGHLHDARRIGSPDATWGICVGNPVHDSIRAAAALAPPTLACDVLLDDRKRITQVFAGELFAMHEQAREAARAAAMVEVAEPYAVVVTTNSGYPLDQNLYQAVKGMAAAEGIVREGGVIVLAAECADGLPDHGSYAELLASVKDSVELLALFDAPDITVPDQWTVQVQARIGAKAAVLVHADGLTDGQLAKAQLRPARDIGAAVRAALEDAGPAARVCVLPEGPQTIPYLAGRVQESVS